MKILTRLFINLLLAVDQLGNTLTGGHPDETISSRLGRSRNKARYWWVDVFRLLVDTLFWFDYKIENGRKIKHCEKSIMPLEQQNFREVADYEIWNWNKSSKKVKEWEI